MHGIENGVAVAVADGPVMRPAQQRQKQQAAHIASKAGLLAVLSGVVIVTLDISLTSTAIPSIAQSLGLSPASTIWIVNIYYLAVVAGLLPLGALGEIRGHRGVFVAGLCTFAAGAAACGLAGSLGTLMAGRALLGVGSAAVSATTPALIRTLYPPARLNQGLGLYAMVVGLALAFGPTAASAVLAVAPWPWLYLSMCPIALLAMGLALRGLPPTARSDRPFDAASAALCAAMFACLLLAIAGLAHLTWTTVLPVSLACFAFAALLVRREAGQAAPILAFDLFRIPYFALSAATSACAFSIQGLVFVVLPLLLHFQLGYSQVEVGLLILPWPLTLALMTLIAAPLSRKVSPGVLGCGGLLVVALGLVSLATLHGHATPTEIAVRLVACGIGFGFFQSPNMLALMSSAPAHRSGGAGGVLAASRLLGQAIGAAAVAFCLSHWPGNGTVIALWLGVAMALAGSVVSLCRLARFAAGTPPRSTRTPPASPR